MFAFFGRLNDLIQKPRFPKCGVIQQNYPATIEQEMAQVSYRLLKSLLVFTFFGIPFAVHLQKEGLQLSLVDVGCQCGSYVVAECVFC